MASATQPDRLSDLIKYEEGESLYSRDQIALAAGNNLPQGAVLGIVTASGLYTEFDPAATDGSETPKAVLIRATDATGADTQTVALRRHCVVSKAGLVWKAGTTDAEILAALAQLETLGIVARETA